MNVTGISIPAPVMKELKAPWTHWSSQDNTIPLELYGPSSEFQTDVSTDEVTVLVGDVGVISATDGVV